MSFDGSTTNLQVIAPTLSINMMVVGADFTAPAPDVLIGMLTPAIGHLVAGGPSISSAVAMGDTFSVSLEVPMPAVVSTADGLWSIQLEAPAADVLSQWTIGGTFTINLTAPTPTILGGTDATWIGRVSPPPPSISSRMYTEQLWEAALAVAPPGLEVSFLEVTSAEYDETTGEWVVSANTWCVNAATLTHAEFTNYNFNSFAKFNGEDIAVNSDGVFTLSGATDDGEDIDSRIMFPPSNFGVGKMNRVDSIYINSRGASALSLVTVFDEETVRKYDVDMSNDQRGIHTKRRKVGKGLSGVNIQIGIENRDGSSFDIESMEVVVVPLLRKS